MWQIKVRYKDRNRSDKTTVSGPAHLQHDTTHHDSEGNGSKCKSEDDAIE